MALTDSEILNIVRRESWDAESYVVSEVSLDREDTLERYLGEDYGDETEGRSQVHSRDVLETIEWAMPSLLRVFASGESVVEYKPQKPGDEDAAAQATDYANYIFFNDNPGFLILNTWFKDGLLSKMGVVKSWWEEKETREEESYTRLTDDEYAQLISDDEVEVRAHSAYTYDGVEVIDDDDEEYDDQERVDKEEPYETAEMDDMGVVPFMPQPLFHDLDITRTLNNGRIRTLPVPPEEFYISRRSADPDTAAYLEHRTRKTETYLLEEGYDEDVIANLPSDDRNDPTGEKETRMGQIYDDEDHPDPAMREITIYESYVFIDIDETGIAQRCKVTWAGEQVLSSEKMTHQPFSIVQPIPVPHRAYGLSFGDLVGELQRIKTVILRQTLDNLYLSNNPEREVNIDKIVSMDDLLMSRPGGIKRVTEIGAIREISVPFVAKESFGMLDGLDSMIASRTGVSDAVTGVDAEVLSNETATASNNQLAAANQRLEMITRIYAETGVRHLFRTYLRLMTQHQDKPRVISLRDEWVEVDPRSWNAEMDVAIDVGLGHGNKDQQVAHLMNLANVQKEMLASGGVAAEGGQPMVTPKHVYNTYEKAVRAVGFKSVDPFFADPGDGPLPQPEQGQDPNAALIQGQMQIEQMKLQGKQAEMQAKMSVEERKAQREHELSIAELQLEREKIEVSREKIAAGMQETAAKIAADKEKSAAQLMADVQKTRADAEEKDKDRFVSVTEKQRDRDTAERAAQNKQPKTVSVTRDDDGNMVGTVNDG